MILAHAPQFRIIRARLVRDHIHRIADIEIESIINALLKIPLLGGAPYAQRRVQPIVGTRNRATVDGAFAIVVAAIAQLIAIFDR